jgi:hypothetical protein
MMGMGVWQKPEDYGITKAEREGKTEGDGSRDGRVTEDWVLHLQEITRMRSGSDAGISLLVSPMSPVPWVSPLCYLRPFNVNFKAFIINCLISNSLIIS